jgi:hypothetical protein
MGFFSRDNDDEPPPRRRTRDDDNLDELRPRPRRREPSDGDDIIAESEPQGELIEVLELIERSREQLNRHAIALRHLFRRYPGLQQKWEVFIRSGGITASDFERFLDGQLQLRPRITRQHRHLRLIISRRPKERGDWTMQPSKP